MGGQIYFGGQIPDTDTLVSYGRDELTCRPRDSDKTLFRPPKLSLEF